MRIKFLGAHMFESKDTRLSCILLDGVMAIDAGALTSGLSFTEQERVEHILLTHGHYDHIRDVPSIALKNEHRTIHVYAIQPALKVLTSHLINGTVYPKFTERPSREKPALKLHRLEPHRPVQIGQYSIMPVPVNHAVPSVGFVISDKRGKVIFYSGDTGPGLDACWEGVKPQVIIMDAAFSNKSRDLASGPGHLCPSLLGEELVRFKRLKRYLPTVILTHLNPAVESEVKEEARELVRQLGCKILLAYEGMEVFL
ncbi:MAG: MBL fold metallo-hydrolase [Chloroflexi bacterium]|nr:MBL fold metallo-hydrolase [Chloroflexota bacterium]